MEYPQKINEAVGFIVWTIQYIEWNLLEKLGKQPFAEMTFGVIVGLVKQKKLFTENKVKELEDILEKRNDLIHHFFKRQDFERQSENEAFLQNQLRYLEKFGDQVDNFNNWLVKQIK